MSDYTEHDSVPAYGQGEGDAVRWSGKAPPPAIGEKVTVSMNGLGEATVVGYFTKEGWLGLLTKLDNPPDWYVKQNGGNKVGHIFGAECKL